MTIVSADTLCYFGDLNGFRAAARSALKGSGLLIFGLEASADYQLYTHSQYSRA